MKQLAKGNQAPDFELLDQNEKTIRLEDYRGKKLLIFFYPRANTPGCTQQACSVSQELPHFTKMDVQAVGISPDKPTSQKKFDEKHTLGFPLLAIPRTRLPKRTEPGVTRNQEAKPNQESFDPPFWSTKKARSSKVGTK